MPVFDFSRLFRRAVCGEYLFELTETLLDGHSSTASFCAAYSNCHILFLLSLSDPEGPRTLCLYFGQSFQILLIHAFAMTTPSPNYEPST